MYKIKRILIERFIYLIALYLTFIIVANKTRSLDIFQCMIAGKVYFITPNPRNKSELNIQFEKTSEINTLSTIYNNVFTKKNDLIIVGDSIYKPMFSNDFYVFRQINNEYKLIHKISSTN